MTLSRARLSPPGGDRTAPLRMLAIVTALCLVLFGCGKGEVTVYAASSLTDVMEEVAASYMASTGVRIDLRFGGTGTLGVEIEHGAPADIFISADVQWFDDLSEKELLDRDQSSILAWNRLVVVVPNSGLASLPKSYLDLPILERISIGDSETVPAGRYAADALKRLGAWDVIRDRLVETHNVRAALALVERGEVEGGIVYASDARASEKVKIAFEIPEQSHEPIVYPAAVLTKAPHPEAARKFFRFLAGPEGRAVFRAYGLGGS